MPLPAERTEKPRRSGLTMMMDWGLGRNRVADHLDLVAPYVDLAKIVVGTARLYPRHYLVEKLALYKRYDVVPFLGGQFSEYVYATQGIEAMPGFFAEAKDLGFEAVEVSDNCVPLSDDRRRELIRMAIDCGLEVHGEVGSKVVNQRTPTISSAEAEVCLDAGCDVVLVEGAELVTANGEPIPEMIHSLRQGLDLEKVLFELTGPWIKGNTLCDVYQLKKFLFTEFGTTINLANVMPDDVLETEALRVGLSVVGPEYDPETA
ncbi:MAG: phosphosulfolactate synthase [Gammaproteobacteria bacterium]|nr:phosphosulfolactate synthase [Gammaproteobacteria bacterium]